MALFPQIHYGLRILMWILRVAIVVFIMIPGTIPALVVTSLTYILSLLDPQEYFYNYVLAVAPWLLITIVITIITLSLYLYIKIETKRNENSNIFEILRIRFGRIYQRYLKFPTFEIGNQIV